MIREHGSERRGQGENSSMRTLRCAYPSTELSHFLVHSSLVPQELLHKNHRWKERTSSSVY